MSADDSCQWSLHLPVSSNTLPAYRKIQNAVQHQIESGRLRPGDAVESERALARLHRVSLMTARHALAALELEGVVQRRRGAGTFVAPPKIHFNRLMSFTEQMAARNLPARSKILHFGLVNGEQEVAAKLALPSEGKLLKIERLRLGVDDPFALEICFLPAADFPGLTRAHTERGSLFSVLEQKFSVALSYADEEVDATAADRRTGQLLQISNGSALLRIRQVIYSTKARPVIYVTGLYPSDRHTLLIRRYR